MEKLKNTTIYMSEITHRNLKTLAAAHGLRMGDALAGLMLLADASPMPLLCRCMSAEDSGEGVQVEPCTEGGHIAQARLGGEVSE